MVTRGSKEGDTDGSNLLELNVGTLDVLLGGLITSAVTNITLVGLGPSPGHGDNERGVGGGEEIGGEVVHPLNQDKDIINDDCKKMKAKMNEERNIVMIDIPVGDGPEPDGGALSDGSL